MSFYEQIVKNGYSITNPVFKAFRKTDEFGNEYVYVNNEKILGEWVYGYRSAKVKKSEDGSYIIIPTIRSISALGDFYRDQEYEIIPETVCIFTGTFDENHSPIYLNDLVIGERFHIDGYLRKGFPQNLKLICQVVFERCGFEHLKELGPIPEHELAYETYGYRGIGTHLWPTYKGSKQWNPKTKKMDIEGDGITCIGIERIGNIFEVENWKDAYKGETVQ